jgi:hypothetical protein
MSKMRENQLTVPLNEPLRAYLEQAAAREQHRSVAGQVRHIVAEASIHFGFWDGMTIISSSLSRSRTVTSAVGFFSLAYSADPIATALSSR